MLFRYGARLAIQERELVAWADSIRSNFFIEKPGDACHGEGLQEAVNGSGGTLQFFRQSGCVPTAATGDEMQYLHESSEPFTLSDSPIGVASFFGGLLFDAV